MKDSALGVDFMKAKWRRKSERRV